MTSIAGRRIGAVLLLLACGPARLLAQGPVPDAPSSFVRPSTPAVDARKSGDEHKFWDKENKILFATSAGLSVADFAVTRSNLQNGGHELNPMARVFGQSTTGLAINFAGENAAVIGLGYFFHRTGHHKLERAVSAVNISSSAFAVGYGIAHR